VNTNTIIPTHPEEQISKLLSLIGQPVRIQILLIIGAKEACVCHLEAVIGIRQAAISQHLMALRKAGLVTTHRDGRNIFYHLTRPEVVDILHQAALITGNNPEVLCDLAVRPVPNCPCPQCNPDIDPELTCQNATPTKIN
jgi:ArsR family transcriptional regulator